ncbi:MAG: 50S ribosomal protein L9 [Candidatus Binatia bacterium]
MEVILREDVPHLGIIGDVVKVKPGYARNYLFPQGLAVAADRRSLARLEHEKGLIELKKQRERGTYERMAASLQALELDIEARAGRTGKLFGSVTNIDVHRLIVEKGLDIDRRRIELKEPIREIGQFTVLVRVGQDITASVPLTVRAAGGMLEGGEDDEGEPSES